VVFDTTHCRISLNSRCFEIYKTLTTKNIGVTSRLSILNGYKLLCWQFFILHLFLEVTIDQSVKPHLVSNLPYFVRFHVFVTTSMEMNILWGLAPCKLVRVKRSFGGIYFRDDGSSKRLWNVSKVLPDYRTGHLRGESSTFSLFLGTNLALNYITLCYFYGLEDRTLKTVL
jgi:hypothetical protein